MKNKLIGKWIIWISFIAVVSCQELQKNDFMNIIRNGNKIAETTEILQNDLKASQTAEVNEYVEILLNNLNEFLKINGMDRMTMPKREKKFKKKILLIPYEGIVYLKNGWFTGVNTTKLYRDAIVTYDRPKVTVRLPLQYETLKFVYDYKAKFMGLGPKGKVRGTVKNLKFTIDLNINLITLKLQVVKLKVTSLRISSFMFSGDILTDFLKNILVPVIKPLIALTMQEVLENNLNKYLQTAAEDYNKSICWLLQNC